MRQDGGATEQSKETASPAPAVKAEPAGQAMAVRERPGALAPTMATDSGFDGFAPDDMIVPRLKIAQPTTQGVAAKGTFVDTLTGESFESVRVVFLRQSRARVLFKPKERGAALDEAPLCRSLDGWVPDPRIIAPVSRTCATRGPRGGYVPACPMAKWTGDDRTHVPPACHDTFDLVGLRIDDGAPFLFSCSKTALAPARGFLSAVALRGRALRDARVTLTLVHVEDDRGSFYVPKFGDIEFGEPGEFDDAYRAAAGYDVGRSRDGDTGNAEPDPSAAPAATGTTVGDAAAALYGPREDVERPVRTPSARVAPSVARAARGTADPPAPWEVDDDEPAANAATPVAAAPAMPAFLRGTKSSRDAAMAVFQASDPADREAALRWIAHVAALPLEDGFEGWNAKRAARTFADMQAAFAEAKARDAAAKPPDDDLPF